MRNNIYGEDGEAVDYSFGMPSARKVFRLLKKRDFEGAEKIIKDVSSDDRTQIMDHIGLGLDTRFFEQWLEQGSDKNVAHLAMGVHYNHLAWMSRSNELAKHVSHEQIQGFHAFQEKSLEHLLEIDPSSPIMDETHSRLIRVYMGNGQREKMTEHYYSAIALSPNMVWPYLRYTEAIQPKWGGNLELISEFIQRLPDNPLIKNIIELKLIADSILFETNYFGGTYPEVRQLAEKRLIEIDKEITRNPPTSIHRYVLYNYMMGVAQEIGNGFFENKYLEKMNGYYTLYPYGIIK